MATLINVNTFKSGIAIQPGIFVYTGFSSPQRAYIVSVDSNTVHFTTYPHYKVKTCSASIFRVDAHIGTEKRIKMLDAQRKAKLNGDRFAFYSEADDHERLYLIDVLNGIVPSEKHNHIDAQSVKVFVRFTGTPGSCDPWDHIESFGYSVSGQNLVTELYEIWTDRRSASQIAIPLCEVVKIESNA